MIGHTHTHRDTHTHTLTHTHTDTHTHTLTHTLHHAMISHRLQNVIFFFKTITFKK